jgi:hypothetical protein
MTVLSYTSYDPGLWRVQLNLAAVRTALGHDDTALVERSLDQVRWSAVRGGSAAAISATALDLDDYEWSSDVTNFYRVTPGTGSVYTDSITPSLDGQVVLVSLRYPFLNVAVSPSDAGDITTPSLGGTFAVMGRSFPVAVTQMRGSAQFSLTLATQTPDDRDALRAIISTGDVLLLQNPPGSGCQVDSGYYFAGDITESRNGVAWDLRWTTLPLTAVDAPGPDVTPVTVTWQSVVNLYTSWNGLIAAQATWEDVLSLVGAPGDIYTS